MKARLNSHPLHGLAGRVSATVVTGPRGCVGERGPAVDARWVQAGSQGECGAVCLAGVGSPTRQAVQQAAAPDRAVWAQTGRRLGIATFSVVEAGFARAVRRVS